MGAPRKNPPPNAAATIGKLASEGHAIIGIAKSLGVSRETFKRWLDDDPTLQDAFDIGRETERHYLHTLIVQAAVLNKGANVNAMFLLKARHGYREGDQQNVQVEVKVQNVLRVPDHGSDAEWAAKAAVQQRRLSLGSDVPFTASVAALPARD